MGWLMSVILFICAVVSKVEMGTYVFMIASGLFAIAGSISEVAGKLGKSNSVKGKDA